MALNFPDAPSDQELSLQGNGVTYKWDSTLTRWDIVDVNGGDYAQGSYTVQFYDDASAGNVSPNTVTGYWTRIGNEVTVNFGPYTFDSTGMTGANAVRFSLPFTPRTTTGDYVGSCVVSEVDFTGSIYTSIMPVIDAATLSSTRGHYNKVGDNQTSAKLTVGELNPDKITHTQIKYTIADADKGVGNPAGLVAVTAGSWTPLVSDGTNDATMGSQTDGRYTKIGRTVHIFGRVRLTSKGSMSGNLQIEGLPFSAADLEHSVTFGYQVNLLVTAGETVGGWVATGATVITLRLNDTTTGSSNLQDGELTNTSDLMFSFIYLTDE